MPEDGSMNDRARIVFNKSATTLVRDQMYYARIQVTSDYILRQEGRRPRSKSEASNKYLTEEEYLEVNCFYPNSCPSVSTNNTLDRNKVFRLGAMDGIK